MEVIGSGRGSSSSLSMSSSSSFTSRLLPRFKPQRKERFVREMTDESGTAVVGLNRASKGWTMRGIVICDAGVGILERLVTAAE